MSKEGRKEGGTFINGANKSESHKHATRDVENDIVLRRRQNVCRQLSVKCCDVQQGGCSTHEDQSLKMICRRLVCSLTQPKRQI